MGAASAEKDSLTQKGCARNLRIRVLLLNPDYPALGYGKP